MEFAVRIGCRVAFDVGAQKGYESIVFARAGMKVAAFEPDVSNFTALKRNITAERVEGLVEVSRAIISDYCGPGSDTFILSLRAYINLTDLVGGIITGHPDLVKIDTDGDDLRVLAGFPFDTCRPALFSVEWDEAGDVAKKLDAEGYKIIYAIYKPQNRWRRAIFSRYSLTPDFQGGEWGDVIGVLPEYDVGVFSQQNKWT